MKKRDQKTNGIIIAQGAKGDAFKRIKSVMGILKTWLCWDCPARTYVRGSLLFKIEDGDVRFY